MRRDVGDAGGRGLQSLTDFVVQFGQAVTSSLSDTGAVQMSVAGVGDFDPDNLGNARDLGAGERNEAAEVFTALGIMSRQLPPIADQHLEVACVRTTAGLVPISFRDLRLKMSGAGPAEGMIALVGYGGGFHSLSPVAQGANPYGAGTIHVVYCPYAFQNGVATKAHALIMDPTPGNESIQVIHGDGMAMSMFENALVLKNSAGDAVVCLDDDGIKLTASQVVIAGGLQVNGTISATGDVQALDTGVPGVAVSLTLHTHLFPATGGAPTTPAIPTPAP